MQSGNMSRQYQMNVPRESPINNQTNFTKSDLKIRQGSIHEKKNIQINRSHLNVGNQIRTMIEIIRSLFSKKKYKNVILSCEMEFFYIAEKIADCLHKHIANLHKIVSLKNRRLSSYNCRINGINKQNILENGSIRLTFNPSIDDRQRSGYQPGKPQSAVQKPISELFIWQCVKRNNRIEVDQSLQKIYRKRVIQSRQNAKKQQQQLTKKKIFEDNKKKDRYKVISRNCRYEEDNRYNNRLKQIKQGKVFKRCMRKDPHDNQIRERKVDPLFKEGSYKMSGTRPVEGPNNHSNTYVRGQLKTRGRGGENKRRF